MKQVALQAVTAKGNKGTVFLQTARVGATGEKGSALTRVFFDGGSQRSFALKNWHREVDDSGFQQP